MKIVRSTKCSIKFATTKKQALLQTILKEYSHVVNLYIDHYWEIKELPRSNQMTKVFIDVIKDQTWLSASMRAEALREAIGMIKGVRERWKDELKKITKPLHRGKKMALTSHIIDLQTSKKDGEFDAWLHFTCIGRNIRFDIPIRFQKHYNRLASKGKQLKSYIITDRSVQFVFQIETGKKREGKTCLGVDTGINALASVSTNEQFGKDIKSCIERVKRCKLGKKGQRKAIHALKQRIDEVAKQLAIYCVQQGIDRVIVEQLKNLGKNSKLKRRLSKNIRRSIGTWNYRYWLTRLEQRCEDYRVGFSSVSPYMTSQMCSCCGYTDRVNRVGEVFQCQKCGYTDNADINASRNISNRFTTGIYGSGYKAKISINKATVPDSHKTLVG